MKIRNEELYLGPKSLKDIFTDVFPGEEFGRRVTKKKRIAAKKAGKLIIPRNQDELRGRLKEGDLEGKILVIPIDCVVTGKENNVIAKHLADYRTARFFFLRPDRKSVVIKAVNKGVREKWIKKPPEEITGLTFDLIEEAQLYPSTLVRIAFEEHKGVPLGICFRGADGIYRIISFIRAFEGAQLLAAFDKEESFVEIEDSDKIDPFYADSINKRIRSVSNPNEWYEVSLSRLALSPREIDFGNWRRTFGVCSCRDYIYSALAHKGSSASHYAFFCKHLALLHNYSLRLSSKGRGKNIRVNLMPYPDEEHAKVLDLLQHRAYYISEKGEPLIPNKATINNCSSLAMKPRNLKFWRGKGDKKPSEYILPES